MKIIWTTKADKVEYWLGGKVEWGGEVSLARFFLASTAQVSTLILQEYSLSNNNKFSLSKYCIAQYWGDGD